MSLHHTRSLAEKVAKWVCSGAPECLHCEAAKALQEVEAVGVATTAVDIVCDGSQQEADAWLLLKRIAEETRTRG